MTEPGKPGRQSVPTIRATEFPSRSDSHVDRLVHTAENSEPSSRQTQRVLVSNKILAARDLIRTLNDAIEDIFDVTRGMEKTFSTHINMGKVFKNNLDGWDVSKLLRQLDTLQKRADHGWSFRFASMSNTVSQIVWALDFSAEILLRDGLKPLAAEAADFRKRYKGTPQDGYQRFLSVIEPLIPKLEAAMKAYTEAWSACEEALKPAKPRVI